MAAANTNGFDPKLWQEERRIFFDVLIPNLELYLDNGKPFICGYDYSVADIAYFNEIQNIMMILDEQIDSKEYPNTAKWLQRIEDIT